MVLLGPYWVLLGLTGPSLGLTRLYLGLTRPYLGLTWPYLGLTWPYLGLSWPYFGHTMSTWAFLGHILALSRPYWVIWVMLGWGHVFAVRHSMAQIRQRKNKIRLSKAQRMPIIGQRSPRMPSKAKLGQSGPIRPCKAIIRPNKANKASIRAHKAPIL